MVSYKKSFALLAVLVLSTSFLKLTGLSVPLPTKGVVDLNTLCNPQGSLSAIPVEEVWKELLGERNRPLLIRFISKNCPTCTSSAPMFEKIAKRFSSELICITVLYEQFPQLGKDYAIKKAPTYMFYNRGVWAWRETGAVSESALMKKITPSITALKH